MAGVTHTQGPAGHTAATTPALLARVPALATALPLTAAAPHLAPPRAHTAFPGGGGAQGPWPARKLCAARLQASGNALPGWASGHRLPTRRARPRRAEPAGSRCLSGHTAGRAAIRPTRTLRPQPQPQMVQEPLPHPPVSNLGTQDPAKPRLRSSPEGRPSLTRHAPAP